uniref:MFS domain-containing protein n=1 Tax=Elaeophora elaphi TaxID=1147741 RepID=A0A0R3RPA0_9BILA
MDRRQCQNKDEMGYELDEASASKQPNTAMAAVSNKLLERIKPVISYVLPSGIYHSFQAVDRCSCCNCAKRWQLAILANFGFLIVFGIRCNFGAAKNHMARDYTDPWGKYHRREFNWTLTELGVMESSFFYGYLLTQIPAGFLAAKFAPNKLFGLAIGLASFFNILLPFAFHTNNDTLIAMIQILQGLVQMSHFGFAGVIWAVFWFALTFESPAFHPSISVEEKKYILETIGPVSTSHLTLASIPWKAILKSKPVYAIIVANFARSWTFYLLLQNQLTYMREVLNMAINDSGLIAALPHAVMGLAVLGGGQLADYLRSHQILSTTAVRKLLNCGGFGGEAIFMLVVAYTKNDKTAVFALILAVGSSGFAISGFNVNHLDIAPRYAAILMGFSNGIGTLAGLTCPFVTEKLISRGPRGWEKVFLLASLIHFTGVTFYAVYASGELQDWAEPKDEEEPWFRNVCKSSTVVGGDYGTVNSEQTGPLPDFNKIWNDSASTINPNEMRSRHEPTAGDLNYNGSKRQNTNNDYEGW